MQYSAVTFKHCLSDRRSLIVWFQQFTEDIMWSFSFEAYARAQNYSQFSRWTEQISIWFEDFHSF